MASCANKVVGAVRRDDRICGIGRFLNRAAKGKKAVKSRAVSRIGIGSKRPYRHAWCAVKGGLGSATGGGNEELVPLDALAPVIGKVGSAY